ncbi:serine/threonine protein phosphatase [Schlesneria sp. T3-172]|uniref:serine/threonine protein phosphatase n=1 Tax=Schlesneria sphaerica TaxID=3373610 RepID=UPI0037CB8C57
MHQSLSRLCRMALLSLGLVQGNGAAAIAAEPLPAAPAGSFSIVLIPDTQAYKGEGTKGTKANSDPVTNSIFRAHTNWIAANLEKQKIVFVSHVGDIVDIDEPRQWQVARDCMDVIHGKVPYGISVGNHDMTSAGDSTLFQQFFPKSRFEGFDWYGGCYSGNEQGPQISGNNANSFQLFTAGGIDWVFLHLECNAPDDVLAWADSVLEKYADRRVLITCHMGWGPRDKPKKDEDYFTAEKGRMLWSKIHGKRGNSPQQIWEKCYRKHANLVAVFSGDQSRTQAFRAATAGDHGNVVHELLQDYGSGWLRLYRFLPTENRVEAMTFNPTTEELCEGTKIVPARSEHQFSFEVPLSSLRRQSDK